MGFLSKPLHQESRLCIELQSDKERTLESHLGSASWSSPSAPPSMTSASRFAQPPFPTSTCPHLTPIVCSFAEVEGHLVALHRGTQVHVPVSSPVHTSTPRPLSHARFTSQAEEVHLPLRRRGRTRRPEGESSMILNHSHTPTHLLVTPQCYAFAVCGAA